MPAGQAVAVRTDDGVDDDGVGQRRRLRDRRARSAAASTASRRIVERDRAALRHARQHLRRSRRARRRDVVQGRPDDERVRPRDRDAQRARPCPRSRAGPRRTTTSSPTRRACTTTLHEPQQVPARTTASDYPGAIGFKTGFTETGRSTRSSRPRRATAARCIAVILGVPDAGYTWAASLLDAGFATPPDAHGHRRDAPAGDGLAAARIAAADQVAFAKLGDDDRAAATATARRRSRPASRSQLAAAAPAARERARRGRHDRRREAPLARTACARATSLIVL